MKEASVPRTAGFFPPQLIAAAALVFTALLFLYAATAANVSWTGAANIWESNSWLAVALTLVAIGYTQRRKLVPALKRAK